MKTYLKIYGPPIGEALRALEQIVAVMSYQTKKRIDLFDGEPPYSAICFYNMGECDFDYQVLPGGHYKREEPLITRGTRSLGSHDFIIEWNVKPTVQQVSELIENIDQAFAELGCKYTITTK